MPATLKCHKARDAELAAFPLTFNASFMQFEAQPQHEPHADLSGEFGEDAQWRQ